MYKLLPMVLILSLFWNVQGAFACSPKPWSYEILAKESAAIVLSGTTPKLMYSDWNTALNIVDNHAIVDMHGNKEEVKLILQKYALNHQEIVKAPDQDAPIWGSTKSNINYIVSASIVALVLVAGYIHYFRKKRK